MSIPEQLRRIILAAPHLPIQMISTIGLIIGTCIVAYIGFNGLIANWQEGTAELHEISHIQERTRDGNPDYFYKAHFNFSVNNKKYSVTQEMGFSSLELATESKEQEKQKTSRTVWYSAPNPNKATMEEADTKWYYYFYALIPVILMLIYLRWLFLKYYELEIEK